MVPLVIYKINNKIHNVSFNLPFRELAGVIQLVECLPSIEEILGSFLSHVFLYVSAFSALGKYRLEEQEFNVILDCITSLGPPLTT